MNNKRRTSLTQDSFFAATREQELCSLRKPGLRQRRGSLPDGKLFCSRDEDVFFNRSPHESRIYNPFKSNNAMYESIFQRKDQKEPSSKGMNKINQTAMAGRVSRHESQIQKFQTSGSSNRRRSLPMCYFSQDQDERPLSEAIGKQRVPKYATHSTRGTYLNTKFDLAHASKKRPSLSLFDTMGISKSISGFMERNGIKRSRSPKSEDRLSDATDDEDIDYLVSLYGRISIDSGYSDRYSGLSRHSSEIRELDLRPDIAEIKTSFCRSKNVFTLSLGQTFLKPSRMESNRGVYVKFCFQSDKIKKHKSKVLPFDENIKWNLDVKFKHLTKHQLETGSINMKFYVPSKYGFTKTCIARTLLNLKRHDYRSPNKISLILE